MTPGQTAGTLLALNYGSASLKAACYVLPANAVEHPAARQTARVSVDTQHDASASADEKAVALLSEVIKRLPDECGPPELVAHRIVHGGDRCRPMALTQERMVELEALSTLAPLHQPQGLALVRAAGLRWPDARQIGVFDTSWHQTMPEKHRLLPIPHSLYQAGVKRYGFHGLAFQSAMRQLGRIAPELSKQRIVLAHLGGGSSLCAVLDGRSVNTTMGMTPLGGIPMASRCGSLDPGVLLHLQRDRGMSLDDIERLLWRESGLRGVSGESGDMRTLLASNSEGARRAIDVYVSGVVQGVAAMAASIGGIDALIFSGGIGTHAAGVRARVAAELGWMGIDIDPGLNASAAMGVASSAALAKTFVLPVDEEEEMVDAIVMLETHDFQQSAGMAQGD